MIRTGNRVFDSLLCSDAVITLRCADQFWVSELIWRLMARNASGGVLYMHWADYHERYWSFDYERFMRICGTDGRLALRNVHVLRAFSKDGNANEANWEIPGDYGLIVLDSLRELYGGSDARKAPGAGKGLTHAIGRFVQLCIRKRATGFIIERGLGRLDNYLAHVSSVIIEVEVSRDVVVRVLKHPWLADPVFVYPRDRQYRLTGWL